MKPRIALKAAGEARCVLTVCHAMQGHLTSAISPVLQVPARQHLLVYDKQRRPSELEEILVVSNPVNDLVSHVPQFGVRYQHAKRTKNNQRYHKIPRIPGTISIVPSPASSAISGPPPQRFKGRISGQTHLPATEKSSRRRTMKRFSAAKPHTQLGQSFAAGCGKWEWMGNAKYVHGYNWT